MVANWLKVVVVIIYFFLFSKTLAPVLEYVQPSPEVCAFFGKVNWQSKITTILFIPFKEWCIKNDQKIAFFVYLFAFFLMY